MSYRKIRSKVFTINIKKKKADQLLRWVENIKQILTKQKLVIDNSSAVIEKIVKNKTTIELVSKKNIEQSLGNKIVKIINFI